MSAVDFASPSYRAGSSDLTISISPLGLVELADEEFEVHGPRLNRYATNWAFYLGHHWGHKREVGETNFTANYCRVMSDYLVNFVYGKGVGFKVPKENEAIVPYLLKRIWETDNDKPKILWEIGNLGSVTGDHFVKVAYEEPWQDPAGNFHAGRVRIIPLNPTHCFPEFHPHDRSRMIRFKLKYRFWGTALEGTRQVFTYTELITDDRIEEYVNDELISQRPNPLGTIPIAYGPNMMVSGSPWGQADIQDILNPNREFNEKATEVSDIINYHASPVTVITGAKASQLERGPKKVWGGLPTDAKVFNLEGAGQGIKDIVGYLEILKRLMHELMGIPESALGQMQPISNTSGVALSIMYMPLMNKWSQKTTMATPLFQRINELALRTLALKEPLEFQYDPNMSGGVPLKPGQLPMLDLRDPQTYRTEIKWPDPLPLDVLIKLNELATKMQMGLESKRGALSELGEDEPDSQLAEIFEELVEDAKDQAALDLLRMNLALVGQMATGMLPMQAEPAPGDGQAGGVSGVSSAGDAPPAQPVGINPAVADGLMDEMTTRAYGTKLPQYQAPMNT